MNKIEQVAWAMIGELRRQATDNAGAVKSNGVDDVLIDGRGFDMKLVAVMTIKALREPTKEMVMVGNDMINECIDYWNYDSDQGYAVETYAASRALGAMIDEALREHP